MLSCIGVLSAKSPLGKERSRDCSATRTLAIEYESKVLSGNHDDDKQMMHAHSMQYNRNNGAKYRALQRKVQDWLGGRTGLERLPYPEQAQGFRVVAALHRDALLQCPHGPRGGHVVEAERAATPVSDEQVAYGASNGGVLLGRRGAGQRDLVALCLCRG